MSLTKKDVTKIDDEYIIGFYNLENLFDYQDDPNKHDEEFLPNSKKKWDKKKYKHKLKNLTQVIEEMGNGLAPDLLGVCEVENKEALTDLKNQFSKKDMFGVIHIEGPDERGIDVGLIYNIKKFTNIYSKNITINLSADTSDRTRDILYSVFTVNANTNDSLHIFICHFPSRREGRQKSEINRLDAGRQLKKFIGKNINTQNSNILIMGDFNDEPWNRSIYKVIGAQDITKNYTDSVFQNLMWHFEKEKRGSYKYRGQFELIDQIIISKNLLHDTFRYIDNSVNIFAPEWLFQKGKYEGYPKRNFSGNNWLNGYSDHLPVYAKFRFIKNENK